MSAMASQITSVSSVWLTARSKKTSKLRVTGLCAGNSPVTGEFPAQRASNAENVSIWWRHHGVRNTNVCPFCFRINYISGLIITRNAEGFHIRIKIVVARPHTPQPNARCIKSLTTDVFVFIYTNPLHVSFSSNNYSPKGRWQRKLFWNLMFRVCNYNKN